MPSSPHGRCEVRLERLEAQDGIAEQPAARVRDTKALPGSRCQLRRYGDSVRFNDVPAVLEMWTKMKRWLCEMSTAANVLPAGFDFVAMAVDAGIGMQDRRCV